MARFICRVGTASGEVINREITANSESEAVSKLKSSGYHVFEVKKKFSLFKGAKKIPEKHFLIFNQEFLALIKAGIPIFNGLSILIKRVENKKLKSILGEILESIKEGKSLAEAFKDYSDYFPPIYPGILFAGEKSGDLAGVLANYLNYQKIMFSTKKKVKSAFVYPAFLVLVAALAIGIIVYVVLPRFSDFYQGFGAQLPLITRMVVATSKWIARNAVFELITVLLGIGFLKHFMSTDKGRVFYEKAMLKIPLIKNIWEKYVTTQFSRTLAILLEGGTPAVQALETLAYSNPSVILSKKLNKSIKMVKDGKPLSEALNSTEFFDPINLDMIKIGEETGSLTTMLKNSAEFEEEELSTLLANITSLVAPFVLLLMGAIIAFILISMYLPLFEVSDIIS
ncbi:type IV pilus assembly protein PilC [Thermotomaculum hydrothermale]|uniref:Type IV pilus assembly protein PilC n=1 Tax=Thermotomaculum hydrothermale TaxID=981385 RepID=A0A7R6PNR2_9BACT|nr:type II secretion system F family protein [Thermotomaculum hydrothermale]BBB32466.1 type IV pilus assembly protein PilC [Thermotomaculum hydrothermale]